MLFRGCLWRIGRLVGGIFQSLVFLQGRGQDFFGMCALFQVNFLGFENLEGRRGDWKLNLLLDFYLRNVQGRKVSTVFWGFYSVCDYWGIFQGVQVSRKFGRVIAEKFWSSVLCLQRGLVKFIVFLLLGFFQLQVMILSLLYYGCSYV